MVQQPRGSILLIGGFDVVYDEVQGWWLREADEFYSNWISLICLLGIFLVLPIRSQVIFILSAVLSTSLVETNKENHNSSTNNLYTNGN